MKSLLKCLSVFICLLVFASISVGAVSTSDDNYDFNYSELTDISSEEETEPLDGFITIDGITYYYKNNNVVKSSWVVDDNIKYRTDNEGKIIRDSIFYVKNKMYYANKNGIIKTDKWIIYKNKKYRAKANGSLYCNQFFIISNKKYFASAKGYIYQNKFFIYKNNMYYATSSGSIKLGTAFKVNNNIYIAKSNGKLYRSTIVTYKKKKCLVGKKGALIKNGSLKINKVKYYATNNYSINKVIIDAPLLSQNPQLPTGCELVSTTMLISYYNNKTYKNTTFYNEVKKYTSPYVGYNGDPKHNGNIYCYPGAVEPLIKKHIGNTVYLNTPAKIKNHIFNGKPVVCWMNNLSGFGLHCVLVTGYNNNSFYYNDPWFNPSSKNASQNKNKKISYSAFLNKFNGMGANAISYK